MKFINKLPTPGKILVTSNPFKLLDSIKLSSRKNIALVDLENISNWGLINSRIEAKLEETHLVYVANDRFGFPQSSLPRQKLALVNLFQHKSYVREASDHFLTSLGTFILLHRHVVPISHVQIISNDKMVYASQASLDFLKNIYKKN